MIRKSPDLLVVSIISALMLVLGLSGVRAGNFEYATMPLWVAPLGILMVLFIPGYAIVSAMLPKVGSEKTLLLSLGLSISISVVGGVVLNLTPWGLTPTTWSLWLSSISLLGLMFASLQRRNHNRNFEMGVPTLHKENKAIFVWAGFILLGAVLIAYISSRQTETTFTQLWAIPGVTSEGKYEIEIGIRNEEKQSEVYNLYIESDGRRLEEWPTIRLESNNEWITTIELADQPKRPIRIALYRANEMHTVYRWLRVSPEAFQ